MIHFETHQAAEQLIEFAGQAAHELVRLFGGFSDEGRAEKSLELVLRLNGVFVETQRIVPVFYNGVAIRDVRDELDLVMWLPNELGAFKKLAIIIELKINAPNDPYGIMSDAAIQLIRYMRSLLTKRLSISGVL